jgi:hypothetical protein
VVERDGGGAGRILGYRDAFERRPNRIGASGTLRPRAEVRGRNCIAGVMRVLPCLLSRIEDDARGMRVRRFRRRSRRVFDPAVDGARDVPGASRVACLEKGRRHQRGGNREGHEPLRRGYTQAPI